MVILKQSQVLLKMKEEKEAINSLKNDLTDVLSLANFVIAGSPESHLTHIFAVPTVFVAFGGRDPWSVMFITG